MAATITTVDRGSGVIWEPEGIERCWFFPHGSDYLKYSPHFHLVFTGGFRQNIPLNGVFVVVMDGKISIKDYWGKTFERIDVEDQIWYSRGNKRVAPQIYRKVLFQGVHRSDQRRPHDTMVA